MNKRILMIAPASIPPTVAEGIVNYKLIKVLCEAGYKVFKFRKFNLQFLIYKCRKYVSYLPPC